MEIESVLKKLENPNLKRIDFEFGVNDKTYFVSAYKIIDIIRIDVKRKK